MVHRMRVFHVSIALLFAIFFFGTLLPFSSSVYAASGQRSSQAQPTHPDFDPVPCWFPVIDLTVDTWDGRTLCFNSTGYSAVYIQHVYKIENAYFVSPQSIWIRYYDASGGHYCTMAPHQLEADFYPPVTVTQLNGGGSMGGQCPPFN